MIGTVQIDPGDRPTCAGTAWPDAPPSEAVHERCCSGCCSALPSDCPLFSYLEYPCRGAWLRCRRMYQRTATMSPATTRPTPTMPSRKVIE